MKRVLRIIAICVLAEATLFGSTGTQETNVPDRVIARVPVSDVSLIEVLRQLSFNDRVPIGIELPDNRLGNNAAKLHLDLTQARLSEILNLIVEQDPSYGWELNDSVVTFTPRMNRDPFLAELLATKVASFAPEKGINKLKLRNAMTSLPEVQALLKKNGVSAFNFGFTSADRSSFAKNIDLRMSDTDVRGILNRISRETDAKLWVVGWDGETRDAIYINF